MPLTPGEANDLVADLVKVTATERGLKVFRAVFEEVREANTTLPKLATFLAVEEDVSKATELAVRAAISLELHVLLVTKLRMVLPGTSIAPFILMAAPGTPVAIGTHQAMFRPGGLIEGRWIGTLNRMMRCVGAVLDKGENRRGTAFLVGPNLVLTAAHVVWDDVDTAVAPPGAKKDSELFIDFRENGVPDPTRPPRRVRAIGPWLAVSSPPCGTPPRFSITDGSNAAANLDFALVRIDERIGDELSYLDVTSPPAPNANEMVAVCGYPGGNAVSVGIDLLDRHAEDIGRLHYKVSTTDGMSGSPCITIDGKAIGVHEGAVKDPDGNVLYNRSVYIGRIKSQILEFLGGSAPVAPAAPGAAPVPVEAPGLPPHRWLTEAASQDPLRIVNALPLGMTTSWRRHPVFGRKKFLSWVPDAARGDAASRVALVGGADGAGKTFTAHLLRSALPAESDVLCVIPPEVARVATAAEIFRRMGDVVLAPSPNGTGATTVVRPETGALRHDVIPDGLDWLQRTLTNAATQQVDRRLWLVVDFGRGDEAWVASSTFWAELLTQAVRRSWVRVVIIGSAPSRLADFRTLLQVLEPPFEDDELQHVTEDEVVDFVALEIGERVAAAELATLRDGFRGTLRRITGALPPEARTAAAALCAIVTKESLVRRGRDE